MSSQRDARRELDRLLAAFGADELTDDMRGELETVLLDRPDLQDDYIRYVALHSLLKRECGVDISRMASITGIELYDSNQALAVGAAGRVASRVRTAGTPATFSRRRQNYWQITAALAASLLIAAVGMSIFVTARRANLPDVAADDAAADGHFRKEVVTLPSSEAIGLLHRVTHTPPEPSPSLPQADVERITAKLTQGPARLNLFNGRAAGGYVVALPPHAELDLSVYADADSENALAILELDDAGQPTGRLVSFSNKVRPSSEVESFNYGPLGVWSERNDTDAEKFFLLTGLQKVAVTSADPTWIVADLVTFVERPELLHLGWDDSGWTPMTVGSFTPHRDYNDLVATLQIRRPGNATRRPDKLQTLPQYDPPAHYQDHPPWNEYAAEYGYPLDLEPGDGVILTAASNARYLNAFAVLHRDTGEIWWSRENRRGSSPHLGVFVIENHSPEPVNLILVSGHRGVAPEDQSSWTPSAHRLLDHKDYCQIVGFEDSFRDQDWDDVRVNLHWLR